MIYRKVLKYIGSSVIPGIPGRDLTEEEADAHGGKKRLIKTGLYTLYKDKNAKNN